eukprot:TRINITY_DN26064_c1_g4_i1.p1 TRINITY_DN26064_c1_g4~~TRINITY_DN26064_c1_g4_i1.p1  ORF type:complete len:284 (+),score=3.01 TRINITY_DN26064_c1_g4_i1:36-854(+)
MTPRFSGWKFFLTYVLIVFIALRVWLFEVNLFSNITIFGLAQFFRIQILCAILPAILFGWQAWDWHCHWCAWDVVWNCKSENIFELKNRLAECILVQRGDGYHPSGRWFPEELPDSITARVVCFLGHRADCTTRLMVRRSLGEKFHARKASRFMFCYYIFRLGLLCSTVAGMLIGRVRIVIHHKNSISVWCAIGFYLIIAVWGMLVNFACVKLGVLVGSALVAMANLFNQIKPLLVPGNKQSPSLPINSGNALGRPLLGDGRISDAVNRRAM